MSSKTPNRLIQQSSPYLLQHAYNPVDWHPWGEEALQKAKAENKLLIISIGYAACHWCHVMEHESFEDKDIAAIMNEYFVPVKVDREERPDIDQVYMNAAYLSTGRGGWPLNAIALPDGRPVFAGTYFPPEQWARVLLHFARLWRDRDPELEQVAERIKEGIRQIDHEVLSKPKRDALNETSLRSIAAGILEYIDFEKGGLDKAPKFPMSSVFAFLLRWHYHHPEETKALDAVTITLDRMLNGGIYDAVGGGFARYSTDGDWFAPHFEKMLYDNGQLVSLYAEAYQYTGNVAYKKVVEQTLKWVEEVMTSEDGLFYSSLDADSEGMEGKFYTWQADELKHLLGEDYEWFAAYYGIQEAGNWEGRNILAVQQSPGHVQAQFQIPAGEWDQRLTAVLQKLETVRTSRVSPALDDKVLVSWNALMVKGYLDAYTALGAEAYLQKAETALRFITENLLDGDGKLYRNYKDGVASVPAFLDDYALLTDALITAYQATLNESYVLKARDLATYAIRYFYHEEEKVFYYNSSLSEQLIVRTKEMSDNVIPASNSIMAGVLFQLSVLFEKPEWMEISRNLCLIILASAEKQGAYHAQWASCMLWHYYGVAEAAFCGTYTADIHSCRKTFRPDVVWMGTGGSSELPLLREKQGEQAMFICRDKSCSLPLYDAATFRSVLKKN